MIFQSVWCVYIRTWNGLLTFSFARDLRHWSASRNLILSCSPIFNWTPWFFSSLWESSSIAPMLMLQSHYAAIGWCLAATNRTCAGVNWLHSYPVHVGSVSLPYLWHIRGWTTWTPSTHGALERHFVGARTCISSDALSCRSLEKCPRLYNLVRHWELVSTTYYKHV